MIKNRLLVIIILLFAHCQAQASVCEIKNTDTDSVTTLLFVGNSLTYTNDLPALVEAFAKKKGRKIKTIMLAYPDYALEDHWNDGKLQKLLATEHIDFVIAQQGPSSQQEGRKLLLDYGARIKTLCDFHHVRLAFFMVWPALVNFSTFDGVIKNYTDAATQTNSILCAVGKTWKENCISNNDYSWYGPDMFHPSQKGSEAAAEIIYISLFNER
jgi:hypothetical protein